MKLVFDQNSLLIGAQEARRLHQEPTVGLAALVETEFDISRLQQNNCWIQTNWQTAALPPPQHHTPPACRVSGGFSKGGWKVGRSRRDRQRNAGKRQTNYAFQEAAAAKSQRIRAVWRKLHRESGSHPNIQDIWSEKASKIKKRMWWWYMPQPELSIQMGLGFLGVKVTNVLPS